tara:strand:+ start:2122 stop:2679 length:558 start_codon:yes stop_codon:yes gene_type:complete
MPSTLVNKYLYFIQKDNEDSYFSKSLILICKNDSSGSFGLIVNKPIKISLNDFSLKSDEELEILLNDERVFLGGPVSPFSPFILHSLDKEYEETTKIDRNLGLSSNTDVIQSILKKEFPNKFIVAFGYTGWSKGQLEDEIKQGTWVVLPAKKDLIFSTPNNDKINEISKISGFDINLVSNNFGNA